MDKPAEIFKEIDTLERYRISSTTSNLFNESIKRKEDLMFLMKYLLVEQGKEELLKIL